MPAVKNETHPNPVAELERLLPHEGSLRNRVSDADAAELVAALEDCIDDGEVDCYRHPRTSLNASGVCPQCRDEADDDRHDRWVYGNDDYHHVHWQDKLEARLS